MMMTGSENSAKVSGVTPPPMTRGTRIVLIGSLALNLLLVGLMAGGAVMGRAPGPFGGPGIDLGVYAEALPPEARRDLRDRLRGRLSEVAHSRSEREVAVSEFLSALRQDPFDPAVIEAIFADQRERAVLAMTEAQDALLGRIAQMPAGERDDFADRLEEGLGHRRRN